VKKETDKGELEKEYRKIETACYGLKIALELKQKGNEAG
jgi:hypothetical protein